MLRSEQRRSPAAIATALALAAALVLVVPAASWAAPAFRTPVFVGIGGSPQDLALGAFAPGTLDDLVVPGSGTCDGAGNQAWVVPNAGNGTFGAAEAVALPDALGANPVSAIGVATGLLSADSLPDVAALQCDTTAGTPVTQVSVVPGTAGGGFGAGTAYAVGDGARDVATGDVNGDGRTDLVVVTVDTAGPTEVALNVLIQQPGGTFALGTPSPVDSFPGAGALAGPARIAVGQLAPGAPLDVAVALSAPGGGQSLVYAMAGDGGGGFIPGTPAQTPGELFAIATGQLDGQHLDDVALAVRGPDAAGILLSDGGGSFGAVTLLAAGAGPSDVAIAELSGGGALDVAIAAEGSGAVEVLAGNGNGTFEGAQGFSAFAAPVQLAPGALDGDGGTDVAVTNAGGGGAALFAQARLALDPISTTFGETTVGTTSPSRPITVRNTGTANLAVSQVAFGGNNPGEFALTGSGCGAPVAPGGTCTLQVAYRPTATGPANGTLNVHSNAPGTGVVHVHGAAVAPPVLTISPHPVLGFPTTRVGSGVGRTVTVRNAGGSGVIVTGVAVPTSATGQFAIFADNCLNRALAPGAACTIVVAFAPQRAGAQLGGLTVTGSFPGTGAGTFLLGTGAEPSQPPVRAVIQRGTATMNRRGRVSLAIRCIQGNASKRCRGRLRLRPRSRRLRPRLLASVRVSVRQGATRSIRLRLGRRARALARRYPRGLATTATLTLDDRGRRRRTVSRTVTVFS